MDFIKTWLFKTNSQLPLPSITYCPSYAGFKAIPYGVTRLQRNCLEEAFLAKGMAEYKGYLVKHGYPSKSAGNQISKGLLEVVQKPLREYFNMW